MEKTSIPQLSSGPSAKGFYVGLYLEHLEEAAFLYEQRLLLFDDPEITWLDIEEWEERFEAHIDALVIGEQLALDVCRMQAAEGDFGELHAAIRVFCRQERMEYLQEALEGAELDDDTLTAITEALKHELPEAWHDMIRDMLLSGEPLLIKIAATIAGFKRLALGDELLRVFLDKTIEPVPEVIHAIGRIGLPNAQSTLLAMLNEADDEMVYEAALALLRTGNTTIIEALTKAAPENSRLLTLIGISGQNNHIGMLYDLYNKGNRTPDLFLALGFMGNASSIPLLMDNLADQQIGGTAAMALNLITGANLYEEVFIPEEIDEDALFEDEREKRDKGEALDTNDNPPGEYVLQLSNNPEIWQKWWQDNAGQFDPAQCYRHGKPLSTNAIVETLVFETSPNIIRKLAYEEWVIKTEQNIPFETNYLVSLQKKALNSILET